MPETKIDSASKAAQQIQYALLEDEALACVRVSGRGNFINSVPLKNFADRLHKEGKQVRFVIDLQNCETLDSTFMGVMASISLQQQRDKCGKLIVANANEHVRKLLKTLGLVNLMNLREGHDESVERASDQFESPTEEEASVDHMEQILHTLEAHKTLCRVDDENEVRFQSVIHYLEASLKDAEK